MLVVISDLHFVDGTAGNHNLPTSAFKDVFMSDIVALAKRKDAKELKLVLLGDIVDLVRTTQWFDVAPADRPWGANGLADIELPRADSATERKCLDILGRLPEDGDRNRVPQQSILGRNWDTFAFFRDFPNAVRNAADSGASIDVELVYVPGNHDRLCNLYPAVRDELQRQLGLSTSPAAVERGADDSWWYRDHFLDPNYAVWARHGHQFDPFNFGGGSDHSRSGHLQATIGDVIACEFASKLPHTLEEMRRRSDDSSITREFIERVQEIDLVRPASAIVEWLYYRLRSDAPHKQALDRAFDHVFLSLLDIPFVQNWRSRQTFVDDVVRALSSRWLRWLPRLLTRLDAERLLRLFLGVARGRSNVEQDAFARAAYDEDVWRNNPDVSFIVYGHTHAALSQTLAIEQGREVTYFNTGTWRERVHRSIAFDRDPDFAKIKHMSYAVFYKADEDTKNKVPGTTSVDFWTGQKLKTYTERHGGA